MSKFCNGKNLFVIQKKKPNLVNGDYFLVNADYSAVGKC